jgi:hypothetical protein
MLKHDGEEGTKIMVYSLWKYFAAAVTLLAMNSIAESAGVPRCDKFRERFERAEQALRSAVPVVRFFVKSPNDDMKQTFAIQSVSGIDGELTCLRNSGQFSSLEISLLLDTEPSIKEDTLAIARFLMLMHAITWAYTQWPDPKVQRQLDQLRQRAYKEAEKNEFRGSPAGGSSRFDVDDNTSLNFSAGGGSGLWFMIDASR